MGSPGRCGFMENDPEHARHLQTLHETGFWGKQGAGCLILARRTGRFLVALRSVHCQQPGTFGTIGGAIDSGENPREAMLREVVEECGFSGRILDIVLLYVFSQETANGAAFSYHNFLVVIEDEFEAHQHWETEKFLWVSFVELSELQPKHFGLAALLLNSGSLLLTHAGESS